MAEQQLRIDRGDDPCDVAPTFATDEQLDRRLGQVEQGLAHLAAIVPAILREVQTVRSQLRGAGS